MRRFTIAATAVLLLAAAGPARACPGCKEALANERGMAAAGARDGYSWTVLGMIVMPFGLLATGGFAVVRAARRGALPEL